MPALPFDFDHCIQCGKELSPAMVELARKQMKPKTCSMECYVALERKLFACCDKAEPLECVCFIAFTCPVHGTKHIGSHE